MSLHRITLFTGITLVFLLVLAGQVLAQPLPGIDLRINPTNEPTEVVDTLKVLFILTILALVPAFMILVTSFTRIIVVLSFVRMAMATQQTPPNQVLIGLALFLTFFIMAPVFEQIRVDALEPYLANEISQEAALANAETHLKEFMLKHTREKDLALFVNASNMDRPESTEDIDIMVLIPAFVISELKTAFQMGFLIFVPFLIIDMVIASTLMSMGMFMVPPIIISLPFKILLFVMTDGWYLIVQSLLQSYGM
ncbi:MAG: flagellar type III secretion system pore protein FliP [Clostridia bacterium]|jgi:flagellar biosynthetic protein FliP|nr:flagellar type III secretion system pore protein FliP [Clostridia bacterium]